MVNSPNQSTVWTAAHCVYDRKTKQWATNVAFLPAYDKGAHPVWDVWPAVKWFAVDGYWRDGNWSYDIAAAVLVRLPSTPAIPEGAAIADLLGEGVSWGRCPAASVSRSVIPRLLRSTVSACSHARDHHGVATQLPGRNRTSRSSKESGAT